MKVQGEFDAAETGPSRFALWDFEALLAPPAPEFDGNGDRPFEEAATPFDMAFSVEAHRRSAAADTTAEIDHRTLATLFAVDEVNLVSILDAAGMKFSDRYSRVQVLELLHGFRLVEQECATTPAAYLQALTSRVLVPEEFAAEHLRVTGEQFDVLMQRWRDREGVPAAVVLVLPDGSRRVDVTETRRQLLLGGDLLRHLASLDDGGARLELIRALAPQE